MRKEETREKGTAAKKDVGGIKAASSGLGLGTWLGLKDPRIVRVSRSFGGKDRHSKVSTVKGLRDRRVRLSVQTAIQVYDLQDRLGLSQPSKVVDWLLNASQHEIDKLPPLQITGNFAAPADLPQPQHHHFHHQMDSSMKMLVEDGDGPSHSKIHGANMSGSGAATTHGGTAARGLMLCNDPNQSTRSSWKSDKSTAGSTDGADHHHHHHQQCGGAEQALKGALLANSTLFPYNAAGMCTTSYFHMEPPPAGAEEPSGAVASFILSSQPDHHQTGNINGTYNHRPTTHLSPPASLSLMPGPQLMLCPSGTSPMPPIFLSNYAAGTTPLEYDAKHATHVDYLSARNPHSTPQSFFSGSLFASFPPTIPTTPYIPNPK